MLFIHLKYPGLKNRPSRLASLKHIKFAYFERSFANILKKYENFSFTTNINNGPIWVCWLQGEDAMPDIVKKCYIRLQQMAPKSRDVILITWENLKKYTDIPDYIIEKVHKNHMTYVHFSDIIRFSLLANHGGLWVDSTIYVSRPITESIFSKPYFSIRTEFGAETEYKYNGVNRCLWKPFLLGAAANSTWFCCAKDIIYEYWRSNSFLIDYFTVDYILLTIYDYLVQVKESVDSSVEVAPYMYEIEKIANLPYNDNHYRAICEQCQWFKLSYKLPFKNTTIDGHTTYIGAILQH